MDFLKNTQSNNNKNNKKRGKKPQKKQFFKHFLSVVLLFLAISFLFSAIIGDNHRSEDVPISKVAEDVIAGEVASITVQGEKLEIEYHSIEDAEPVVAKSKKEREGTLSETLVNYGVTAAQLSAVEVHVENEGGLGYWLLNILPILVPILFIVLFFWFISGQMKGAGMKAFSFGQSKARITDPSKQKITFKDVAGNKEAKEELKEIVDFLKNPRKFIEIGAQIPKGVLLMGSPGTGKTLLARAVAGEARVPFFHLSGSEFVEMFVGVGASRVRDLFQMAKKAAPAIIFIDEIDAVGRSRGVGIGGGNDEREQTLNQILVEMDGFEPNEKVIILAATNRPDVLDPALLRPGRFDRRVILDVPDRKDREEILKIHAQMKPLAEDVNLELIATRTPGFSGADLFSLMNEAAILAAREDRKKVSQFDLIRSIEKVMIGPERKSHLFTEKEKKITAYHEAGHAVIASALPNADPVHKVSIVARGRAGGYTLKLPLEEKKLQSKKEFIDDIAMSLGGYAAEKMIFGDITTGPSNDLQVVTRIARSMVTKWGMSDAVGPIAIEGDNVLFAPASDDDDPEKQDHSKKSSILVGAEVSRIIKDGLETATRTLEKHRKALDAVAEKLLEVETLEQEEYNRIIEAHGIKPRVKDKEKGEV